MAILGGLAMVMFAIIFFRLWYLQVLSGEQYVQQAKVNDQRVLPIPGPARRNIRPLGQTDRNASTVTNAVQILPSALPEAVREQASPASVAGAGL